MLKSPGGKPFTPTEEATILARVRAGEDLVAIAAAFKTSPPIIQRLAKATLKQRLLAKVVLTPEGCWEWTGAKNSRGYPYISVGGKMRPVANVAYQLRYRKRPRRVWHTCGNPLCVCPEHLCMSFLEYGKL